VLVRALESGRDMRIGLEDTLELPDGRRAGGNGELVAAAVELARVAGRRLEPPPSGTVRP
jgi:3-keto-5-aminohexanoate cleavage enzyme